MTGRDGGGRHAAVGDRRGADGPVTATDDGTATETDGSGILEEQLFVQARQRPRRATRVPRLVAEALALVWSTSRIGTFNVVAVQFVSAGIAAVQVLVGGYAVKQLVNDGREFDVGSVLPALVLLAVVTMIGSLGTSGMSQLGRVLGIQVQGVVQSRVLDVTTGVDLVQFDDPTFHDQLQRVNANVPTQPYNVVSATASLVGGVVGAVSLAVTLVVIQPLLVVLLLVAGLPLWWLSRRGGDLEFAFATVQAEPFRERGYVVDTLTRREGAAEVRAFRTAPWLRRRWETSYDTFVDAMRRHVRRRYLLNAASTVATGIVTVVTLVVLVLLVDGGHIGVGGAASAAVAIRLLAGRLQQLFGGLSTLFQASVFLEDFQAFLARSGDGRLRAPSTAPAVTPDVPRSGFAGVTARDVSFRYPSADADAVRGVSLDLAPGEVVALVGENGSGKTTLAKLLGGLYAPTGGDVLWRDAAGEVPLAGDAGRGARDRVGLVLQDFLRYQLSAADNIALGRPELPPDRARIEAASRRVNADEFLAALPDGYDTRLSKEFKGGRELSQGQWQRVALARVFYRDSDLVILDEPTAALDPRAEHQLFRSVREVLGGRTVVLITHRLQSVREADRILVMRDGVIAEQGDHTTLMAAGGLYAELVDLQSRGMLSAGTAPAVEGVVPAASDT